MTTEAIHVQLAVQACDRCPIAELSERTPVEQLRVDSSADRVQFVADELESTTVADPSADTSEGIATDGAGVCRPASADGLDLVTMGSQVHGRYDVTAHNRSCGDCGCLTDAFDFLPVSPIDTTIEDGTALFTFVLADRDELGAVVDALEEADLDVELRRLLIDPGDETDSRGVVPVDLTGVTERQAEVAAAAAEMGYFRPNGSSAEELGDELGIAKSTVSEHLRTVLSDVIDQLFAADDVEPRT